MLALRLDAEAPATPELPFHIFLPHSDPGGLSVPGKPRFSVSACLSSFLAGSWLCDLNSLMDLKRVARSWFIQLFLL